MSTLKTIFTLSVSGLILGAASVVQGQNYLPVTSGTFYNNVNYADVYQFNVPSGSGSEFNGSQIAISGGQIVAWDVIDSDASSIGGSNPANATTVEIDSFGTSAFTPGTPNALLIGGGANIVGVQSGILSYVTQTPIFDGITGYNATTFTGAFDISNQFGIYGNNQYSCAAEFAGIGGASGIMADEITSYYPSINNYVSIVDDPPADWIFVGSFRIPDEANTFELLLTVVAVVALSRRHIFAFPSRTAPWLYSRCHAQLHPRH